MNEVRQLLKNKEYIETAMQRADPLMRLVMQRQLDVVCGEIEKAREEWHKLFEPQEIDQLRARVKEAELKNRIAELEREVQDYKEENVRLLKQCLALSSGIEGSGTYDMTDY